MGRHPKLISSRNRFVHRIESCKKLYELCNSKQVKGDTHTKYRSYIIEIAFLTMVSAWDEFLTDIFLRYLRKSNHIKNIVYKTTGFPKIVDKFIEGQATPSSITITAPPYANLSKAKEALVSVILGRISENSYISWTAYSPQDVAKKFFDANTSLRKILAGEKYKSHIAAATTIRNRIAHDSDKCKNEFSTLVKRYSKKTKLMAGEFLSMQISLTSATSVAGVSLFQEFMGTFESMAKKLAP